MSMNEIMMSSGDLLIFVAAIAVSFILGGLYKMRRNLLRQRRAVELGKRDLKALVDRCDRQQISMTRLDQEVTDMRQAMLQQALALLPIRSAVQAPAAAVAVPEPIQATPPVAVAQAETRVSVTSPAAPQQHTSQARPSSTAVNRPPAANKPPARPAANRCPSVAP